MEPPSRPSFVLCFFFPLIFPKHIMNPIATKSDFHSYVPLSLKISKATIPSPHLNIIDTCLSKVLHMSQPLQVYKTFSISFLKVYSIRVFQ